MAETEFASHLTATDHPAPRACSIRIKDSFLNYALSDGLKAALSEAVAARIAGGTRAFVLDLSCVTVMDSCGLSALISVKKIVDAAGGRTILVALSPMILRLFTITKLDRVFEIHADERAAFAALAKKA
jgi:anti-anti-sigma factor